jgi:hypothetical protein
MSLLRFAIQANAIHDEDERDAPSLLTFLVQDTAAIERNQRAFDRETAECDAIVQARPVGVQGPRDEPKSIHSPAPAARIRFEAPKRRKLPDRGVSLQGVDWSNKADVMGQARRLGPGMTVVKHADRPNYNITHTERRDLWDRPGVTVVGRT